MERDVSSVFVRNLPLSTTDDQLKQLFADVGPVRQAFLVKTGGGSGDRKAEAKSRGYGFVQFAVPADAARAVASWNGHLLQGRRILVEEARKDSHGANSAAPGRKARPVKQREHQQPGPQGGVAPQRDTKGAGDGAASGGEVLIRGLDTAVGQEQAIFDWLAKSVGALEHLAWPAPAARLVELGIADAPQHAALVRAHSPAQAARVVQLLHGSTKLPCCRGPHRLWAREVFGEGSKPKRWRLIVRNLAFRVDEATLREVFSAAGFVWEAHVPLKPNGAQRGFGFVAYTRRADAQCAIEMFNGKALEGRPLAVDWALAKDEYNKEREAGGTGAGLDAMPTDAPLPPSEMVAAVEVDTDSGGHAAEASEAVRPAEVVRARNTQTAHPVVKEAKVDKRNLWLAREGEVPLNSAAAIGVSTADMEKRQAAAIEKGEKLRNPNYHVSTVRLLFRNLPATLTEKQLQRLCLDALQEKTTNNLRVKHTHLLRDSAKVDKSGANKSRGIGFVEFANPEDALSTLRTLNNNPFIFTKDKRPIVEFAIEDARAGLKSSMRKSAAAAAQKHRTPK